MKEEGGGGDSQSPLTGGARPLAEGGEESPFGKGGGESWEVQATTQVRGECVNVCEW